MLCATISTVSRPSRPPYDLVTPGGHGGKVRDPDAATVLANKPLEQKTASFWVAVRNPLEVTDDNSATPTAVAKNTTATPNSGLLDIIALTSHAGVDVEQRFEPGIYLRQQRQEPCHA
jgi:hypothetical protein